MPKKAAVAPWLKKKMPVENAASMSRFDDGSDDDAADTMPLAMASLPAAKASSTSKARPNVAPSDAPSKTAAPAVTRQAATPAAASIETSVVAPSAPRHVPAPTAKQNQSSQSGHPSPAAPRAKPAAKAKTRHTLDADAALVREEDHDLDIVASADVDASAQGDDDDDTDEDGDEDFVNVTFEFYDPEPTDFWSIEHFLRDYVDDQKDFPAQAMAQAISNQAVVGTTIKTGAGEYPIGFMSVLNVHTYRDHPAVQLTREFLLRHCGDARKKRQLQSLFDQASTRPLGLLLHDRVINCPPELVPHMHQAFVDDVAWAVENETTPEKQESFKFHNYIIICRVYKDDDDQSQRPSSFEPSRPAAEADEDDDSDGDDDRDEAGGEHDGKRKSAQSGRRSKKAKRKQTAISDDGAGATFFKFEEEFYHKHASLVFACPVSHISPASAYADVPQARLAVVVAASKMKAVVADITDLVQEEQ